MGSKSAEARHRITAAAKLTFSLTDCIGVQAIVEGEFRILFLDAEAGVTAMPHGMAVPARSLGQVRALPQRSSASVASSCLLVAFVRTGLEL
jgi:hypothetical protein